jgi:hypothetical protein
MTDVDHVRLAAWLNVDDTWLRHVINYDFNCSCKIGCTEDGHEETYCRIWEAGQRKIEAEEELAKAEAAYEKAKELNRSMEVGR